MKKGRFLRTTLTAALLAASTSSHAFTLKMSGDGGEVGQKAESGTCQIGEEAAFTGIAGDTVYTDEKAYSGSRSLKMTVQEGSTGFGSLGGAIRFTNCTHVEGRNLVKGDELWIRTRLWFPEDFEFHTEGRNKFFRFRAHHLDEFGSEKSEGYNDLYINGHPEETNFTPFHFIFEGSPEWYKMGSIDTYFDLGSWNTVEMYLKLDNLKESEGGDARVRVWFDGELIGDTGERRTLKQTDSYLKWFYLFTWWGNSGAHKTQSFYVDDLMLTTDQPMAVDSEGNRYIGLGEPQTVSLPQPPASIAIE